MGQDNPGYPPYQSSYHRPPYPPSPYSHYGRGYCDPYTRHIHPLFPQDSYSLCKICNEFMEGGLGMICRDCDLLICQHCFDRIYHGRKLDYIHRHPLVLTVRTNWYCNC